MLLTAYFDETNTHAWGRLPGMSGFIARADLWREIENAWNARLAEDGIKVFHAHDCQQRRGEFSDVRYWTDGQVELLFSDLGRIMGASGAAGIISAVLRPAWDEALTTAPLAFRERFKHPYHFCFEHCLQQSLALVDGAPGAQIAFVFAEHQEYQGWASRIGEAYELSNRDRRACVSFGAPKKLTALQTADWLAYNVSRAAIEGDRPEYRPALIKIFERQGMLYAGYFGLPELQHYIKSRSWRP